MSATLPPGWTGTTASHRIRIGAYYAWVEYDGDGFCWTVEDKTANRLADGANSTPDLARLAALTALQTLLTTAVADVGAALANLNDTEP